MSKCWSKFRPATRDLKRSVELTFRDNEDLYELLGLNGEAIKPRLESKYTLGFGVAMGTFLFIFMLTLRGTTFYYVYTGFMACTCMILQILFILGMNRNALKRVVTSFTFLFEIYQGIIWQIYFCVNNYYMNPDFNWYTRIMWTVETVLFIFIISAIDASSLRHNLKWGLTGVLATAFTLCAIFYRFGVFSHGEYVWKVFHAEYYTQESFISCAQVIAILYWRRALALFRGGPTGEAISIQYSSYVNWVHNDIEVAGKAADETADETDGRVSTQITSGDAGATFTA